MSLNFDFSEMIERLGKEEYDRITDHPNPDCSEWHPVTDGLIWMTMIIGLPGITEKNVDKFVTRVRIYQQISGCYMQGQDGPFLITEQDIRNHIGLSTNVSTQSDAAFNKNMIRIALELGEAGERIQMKKTGSAFDMCQPKQKDDS